MERLLPKFIKWYKHNRAQYIKKNCLLTRVIFHTTYREVDKLALAFKSLFRNRRNQIIPYQIGRPNWLKICTINLRIPTGKKLRYYACTPPLLEDWNDVHEIEKPQKDTFKAKVLDAKAWSEEAIQEEELSSPSFVSIVLISCNFIVTSYSITAQTS
ncbi:hypothetical protein QE152_g39731 [Popillia japonica]|uniref:Uncharacterized protein n=1 Tax=Popillia japonica TaxID=7064 RepID=A0AAW1HTE3_POPJA